MVDSDGGRFTYSYRADGLIDHLVNPQADRTSYSYDAAGRRTQKDLANGTRASFSYDKADNLTFLTNFKSDDTIISSFDYKYDNVNNRQRVIENNGARVAWSYDITYQLTAEHRSGANAYANTFTYDAVGNRMVKEVDGARTSTVYDAANQIEYSVSGLKSEMQSRLEIRASKSSCPFCDENDQNVPSQDQFIRRILPNFPRNWS